MIRLVIVGEKPCDVEPVDLVDPRDRVRLFAVQAFGVRADKAEQARAVPKEVAQQTVRVWAARPEETGGERKWSDKIPVGPLARRRQAVERQASFAELDRHEDCPLGQLTHRRPDFSAEPSLERGRQRQAARGVSRMSGARPRSADRIQPLPGHRLRVQAVYLPLDVDGVGLGSEQVKTGL